MPPLENTNTAFGRSPAVKREAGGSRRSGGSADNGQFRLMGNVGKPRQGKAAKKNVRHDVEVRRLDLTRFS
jgi:hypothetical protein